MPSCVEGNGRTAVGREDRGPPTPVNGPLDSHKTAHVADVGRLADRSDAAPGYTMPGLMVEPAGVGTAAKGTLAAFRIGDTTKRNNRLALRQYEDLVRWARDVLQEEARELDAKREELNKRNLFYSGYANSEETRIRDAVAQRWRDRKSEADRKIEDLHDSENVLHRAWRKLKRPWPENPYEEELQRISQGWEERA